MKQNNSAYVKLGKNIGLLTIGNFASKLLNYFLVPLYTAVLTTAEYGTADIIMTTVSLVLPICTLQISDAVMRFLLEGRNSRDILDSSFFILKIGVLFVFVFSPVVFLFESISGYYWLFIGILLADVFNTYLGQYVKGIENVSVYSFSGVINTFVVAISNIVLLLLLKLRIEGYLASYLLGYTVSIIYLLYKTRINIVDLVKAKPNKSVIKELLTYAIPLVPNAICWWVNNSSDKYFVRFFCDASATGIYAISYKIPSLLSTIMVIFFAAWQISSVTDFGSEKSKRFYSSVFEKTMLLNTFIGLMLIVFAKFLGGFLYENDFFCAWKYTIPLIIAFYFNTLAAFMGSVYTASKKTKMLFVTSVVSAVVNIILNVIFIPKYGVLGAAIATIVSYFVIFVIRIVHTKSIFNFRIDFLKLTICCIIISFSGFASYTEFEHELFVNVFLVAVFVFLMFFSLKEFAYDVIRKIKPN